MSDKFNNGGNIFQKTKNQSIALFDPQTIRESWVPVAAGWRRVCGHYHDIELSQHERNDPARWTSFPQDSSVVFATDGRGTVAAVRVLNGDYVGIISMFNYSVPEEQLSFEVPDDAVDLLLLWVDGVLMQLT